MEYFVPFCVIMFASCLIIVVIGVLISLYRVKTPLKKNPEGEVPSKKNLDGYRISTKVIQCPGCGLSASVTEDGQYIQCANPRCDYSTGR